MKHNTVKEIVKPVKGTSDLKSPIYSSTDHPCPHICYKQEPDLSVTFFPVAKEGRESFKHGRNREKKK